MVGESARSLFADAQAMLDKIVAEKWLTARGVAGFGPARVMAMMSSSTCRGRAPCPPALPAPADPQARGPGQYLPRRFHRSRWRLDRRLRGGHPRHRPAPRTLQARIDDYSDILLKALADRFAEAFAERLHQHVRTTLWGYAPGEQLTNEALIREEYRGIRPAPGYPACPDHSLKPILFDLLDATAQHRHHADRKLGHAADCGGFRASTSATRKAEYFGVARIGHDQLDDYAARRGIDLDVARQYLRPNLNE